MVIKILSLFLKSQNQKVEQDLTNLQIKHLEKLNILKLEQEEEKLKQLQIKNALKTQTIKLKEGLTYSSNGVLRDILTIELFKGGLNIIYRQFDYKRDTQALYKAQEFKNQQEAIAFFGKTTKDK